MKAQEKVGGFTSIPTQKGRGRRKENGKEEDKTNAHTTKHDTPTPTPNERKTHLLQGTNSRLVGDTVKEG